MIGVIYRGFKIITWIVLIFIVIMIVSRLLPIFYNIYSQVANFVTSAFNGIEQFFSNIGHNLQGIRL